MSNLGRPLPPALQRWPALVRAAQQGVRVEVAPGLVAMARLGFQGDNAVLVYDVAGHVDTPAGRVAMQNRGYVSADVDTVGRVLTFCERRGMVPKLSQILAGNGGRPLLNLPR